MPEGRMAEHVEQEAGRGYKPPKRATGRAPRRGTSLDKDRSLPKARAEHAQREKILAGLAERGSVRITQSQAAKHLPVLLPELERRFPGKRVVLEGTRLRVRDIPVTGASLFGTGSGLGRFGFLRNVAGDVPQLATGLVEAAADYGTAFARDVRDVPTGHQRPFRRTTNLAMRDALGLVGAAETAIPTPSWVPKSLRKEVVQFDPQTRQVEFGGPAESAARDTARAKEFWTEDPLIAALTFAPFGTALTRRSSQGAIEASLLRANAGMTKSVARKIARKESKMPGYAAAQGYEGGIAPRVIKGEYMEAAGRPQSRAAIGRAGQRVFDQASNALEARTPGVTFSASQRAARLKERELSKARAQTEMQIARDERDIHKGVGRDADLKEALIAVLEAPKALTPWQALKIKLADLRSTIERPRTRDEALARAAQIEAELAKELRPVVDHAFPVASRRVEQARRNVLRGTKGKRAAQALETKLELEGIGKTGSVLADAYAKIEEHVARIASQKDAHPEVRRIASMIEERDALRAAANDPDVAFGDAAADFGVTGAAPDAASRLDAQVAALEKVLASGKLKSPEFAKALAAAERIAAQADETAATVLGMTSEELASRRNRVAQRYAEKGLLPEGVAVEARGFFPHREEFENVAGGMRAPTMAATGGVVGRPAIGRFFARKENKLKLYEQGRVQAEPRVLTNTLRQRTRYMQTIEARKALYDGGKPIVKGEPIPDGIMLVRNPEAAPEQIPQNVKAAIENPERYGDLTTGEGGVPNPETFQQWVDSWLYRGGPEPEWLVDLQNVRAVPERVVRTLLVDVFRDAPRGSFMAILGSLNALGRAVTIYTPYLGVRYIARNTPQNMILLALTRPRSFKNVRQAVTKLRRSDPEVYNWIKVEAGTIPAAAGLPELAGRKRNLAQKTESVVTRGSRKIANVLGEISDEPWRVSSHIGYMKAYGFKSPADWRRLMESKDPALVRVRNDIAQRVRDDMIDFDSLPPGARENLGRIFFILPFVVGSFKWPLMYLREYPTRSSIMALITAQHAREGDPGSVWEQGQVMIGGTKRDVGWGDPTAPFRSTVERAVETVKAIPEGPNPVLQELSGFFAPQYREPLRPYQGWEGVLKSFVPLASTKEKIGRGGGIEEQALRMLGATVELRPSVVAKRRAALEKDFERAGLKPSPELAHAWQLQERLAAALGGEKSPRDKVAAAFRLAGRMKLLDGRSVQASIKSARLQTEHENENLLGRIEFLWFGARALARARTYVNDVLAAKKLEPTE